MMSDLLHEQEDKNYDFLKKYVMYCKRFHPKLSEEARIMLCQYYVIIATKFGSPRVLDALLRISHAIARLNQKEIIDNEDAKEAMQFYNVILQQLSEVVAIPKDPRDLAVEEITNTLSNSKFPYDFVELVKDVCKRDESIAQYIGDNFSVVKNKRLRRLRDRFKEGTDNRMIIVSLKPLVLAWRSSYNGSRSGSAENGSSGEEADSSQEEQFKSEILHSTDLTDPTDQEKTEMIPKNNIRNHSADGSGRLDRSVGCNTSIEDSSSIKTVNSRRGCFGCFYCTECHSSDQERTIHIDNAHPRKLHYPTPKYFENRLRPNK